MNRMLLGTVRHDRISAHVDRALARAGAGVGAEDEPSMVKGTLIGIGLTAAGALGAIYAWKAGQVPLAVIVGAATLIGAPQVAAKYA